MDKDNRKGFDLYRDISGRTNGEVYLGVVGPVRTGKSTFIKRFMEHMVLPYMEDDAAKARTVDELPQSAQGRMIMTTEPKFVPKDAAEIDLKEAGSVKVRLIDCVGFMVEGASGHMDGDADRMVKTPWLSGEIPFKEAAEVGTKKVIRDHATVGIVVTTDGSIGEIDRENYILAEERTIKELDDIGKPYVVVLNCTRPYADETVNLAAELREKYNTAVIPVNCEQLRNEDVNRILEQMLYEFPVSLVEFYIPKWTRMLDSGHPVKNEIIKKASEIMRGLDKACDIKNIDTSCGEYLSAVRITDADLSTGCVKLRMEVKTRYYYENISELSGVSVKGEYELISLIREMASMRKTYGRIAEAYASVTEKGYGVVKPELSDIVMDEPKLIRHGNKYGVRMRAESPSIHMIRASIETEIAPIVGSEAQANDLISYIKEGQMSDAGAWETNIFGKSIGELMEDGIHGKIALMDDECQIKLQDTMQKIVNDNNGGMVCIII